MPMHDWTRVPDGIFHAFHNSWITHLQEALNAGLLPSSYYALGEQRSGDIEPDLLTLRSEDSDEPVGRAAAEEENGGMIAVAEAPPRVRLVERAEEIAFYLSRQRRLAIRHVSGDRIVALVEIVSAANKHTAQTLEDFVDKIVASLREGIHLLVIDPQPPSRHDPDGIHGLIWERLLAGRHRRSPELPLTLVSYCVSSPITAYVEPLSVGSPLIDMPIFLTPTHYILAPLEETYTQSWSGVPQRWRRVVEGGG
ncbi:MAG: DUF4058 family protein [Planctomycetes bacterium]|nr:DUF4058 family protein [Planctomycetota bacterium]